MSCEKPQRVLITVDGCSACATWKQILEPQIKSGEIEVAPIEQDRAVDLIWQAQQHPDWDRVATGVPQALEVCSLEDVKPVEVQSWRTK